jgi:Ca-activated chloride channel family protein
MKTLGTLIVALVMAAPAWAQGWIEPPPNRPGQVTKLRSVVMARVVGRVAEVEVEEWFRNDGGGLGEGDYLYPLPGEAVFSNFSLFQGDQELRGETMDASAARAIYEEIVRRKRDPALIELAGHGLIRARIFPIAAGETRKITLRYTQVLERAGDALQFRYAAGVGHGGAAAPGVERPSPGRIQTGAPVAFTLVVESGATFRDPFSPTHQLTTARQGERLEVRPAGDLTGDLTIVLPFARRAVGISVVTHREPGDDGYFMLTLTPDRAVRAIQPRDVTVILDVSGSMSGHKIEQARAALRQLLGTLGPDDRFRLVAFSSAVRVHADGWTQASAARLQDAREWIDRLTADGGTNIAGALQEGFRLDSPEQRLPIVVFLTDGLPSVGEQDPERLAELASERRDRARIFAFGVGHDVNTYLLDALTAAARGATQYVQPGENVEAPLRLLAAKIQHPVLTELALDDTPVRVQEIYPVILPDLFAGEDLVIFGRYVAGRGDRMGDVTITGRRTGEAERYTTTVTFPTHRSANDFIPRLWAARKVGVLARELRLHGPNPELMEELRATALRYGLLSEYTSYLVQEPEEGLASRDGFRSITAVPMAQSPAASVGAGAVASAEQARRQREAKGVADLAAVDEEMLNRAHVGQARHVEGRLFRDSDDMWTDLRHTEAQRIVRIEAFSDAYFAVLAALPELEPYVSELGTVLVAGAQVSIAIDERGATRLTDDAVARLVREFRGR